MRGAGSRRRGLDLLQSGWAQGVIATPRGFLTDRGAGAGRDQRADCSRGHAGTGLAQICEAVRRSGGRVRRRWAIRKGAAGRVVWRERC